MTVRTYRMKSSSASAVPALPPPCALVLLSSCLPSAPLRLLAPDPLRAESSDGTLCTAGGSITTSLVVAMLWYLFEGTGTAFEEDADGAVR